MRLSDEAKQILTKMVQGSTLKSHRNIDGEKVYRLHPLTGKAVVVSGRAMDQLRKRGLIDSNKKFPAATYLLTAPGQQVAVALVDAEMLPLAARNFGA